MKRISLVLIVLFITLSSCCIGKITPKEKTMEYGNLWRSPSFEESNISNKN